jgi:hypothetical protein
MPGRWRRQTTRHCQPHARTRDDNGLLCGPSIASDSSDNIRPTMRAVQVIDSYDHWLSSTALAARSKANYRRWVVELVDVLDAAGELAAFLAPAGEDNRRAALTDWRRRLIDRGLAPATVNLALAAATSLLVCHALACPAVPRIDVPAGAARALTHAELRALERALDGLPSARDRAILQVLLRPACGSARLPRLTSATCR